jgi:hypothetical protein
MISTNLIGNEAKKDEDLIETALNNSVIRDIIRGKSSNKVIYSKDDYLTKAKKLHENIENYFPKDENGLVCFTKQKDSTPTIESNALLAVDKFLLGQKDSASALFQSISNNIEFENYLVNHYKSSEKYVGDNLGLAVSMYLFGHTKDANSFFSNIIDYFPFDRSGLIKQGANIEQVSASDNALLSIAYALQKDYGASGVVRYNIRASMEYNDELGLYFAFKYTKPSYFSDSNSLFAVARYLNGEKDEAKKILTNVEKYFGFTKEGLVKCKEVPKVVYSEDSIAQVFAYLTLAGKMDEYLKK